MFSAAAPLSFCRQLLRTLRVLHHIDARFSAPYLHDALMDVCFQLASTQALCPAPSFPGCTFSTRATVPTVIINIFAGGSF